MPNELKISRTISKKITLSKELFIQCLNRGLEDITGRRSEISLGSDGLIVMERDGTEEDIHIDLNDFRGIVLNIHYVDNGITKSSKE